MKSVNVVQLGLRLRLGLSRLGWGKSLATLLCVACVCAWLWGVPHLKAQSIAAQDALKASQRILDVMPPTTAETSAVLPLAERHLRQFYDALGETRYAEQQIKTLFAIAAKNGLTLNRAEYKFAYDKNGRFHTYVILLPVQGPYVAIRSFCEQVLLAIPFASLDDIGFKREAIGSSTLEATLHFTLYLDDASGESKENGSGDAVANSYGRQENQP